MPCAVCGRRQSESSLTLPFGSYPHRVLFIHLKEGDTSRRADQAPSLDQFLHWSPSAQQHLSPARVLLLQHMITTFRLLSPHEEHTRMSARNYTICFAPDLIRGPNPLEDLELCLEPGKALPLSMTKQVGGAGGQMERAESKGLRGRGNTLVGVLELWIRSDAVGH